jgi:bifunctional DNA-binding transcriptional regulator/antitoxin component of YhaV-PrlF toxin-antitoxin module
MIRPDGSSTFAGVLNAPLLNHSAPQLHTYHVEMTDGLHERRRPGHTRVSRQHQVTLPVEAMRQAGLRPGDRVRATSPAPGVVMLEREEDPLDTLTGDLTGRYQAGQLDGLRDEWR